MSCDVMSHHVMSYHVIGCGRAMSFDAMSCHVMSCHVMPCRAMPCHQIASCNCFLLLFSGRRTHSPRGRLHHAWDHTSSWSAAVLLRLWSEEPWHSYLPSTSGNFQRIFLLQLLLLRKKVVDLMTVLKAIFTGRQHAKLQYLYGNPRTTFFLENWILNE